MILQPGEGTQFPTVREMRAKARDLLVTVERGRLVTYTEWTLLLGLDPQQVRRARSAILLAGRDVLLSDNKCLRVEPNIGYRVVEAKEQASIARGHHKRGQRQFHEGLLKSTHVELADLTPAELATTMTEQARSAMLYAVTRKVRRAKQLPARNELHIPTPEALVKMMRRVPRNDDDGT